MAQRALFWKFIFEAVVAKMLTEAEDAALCNGLLKELCGPPVYCRANLRGEFCSGHLCGLKHLNPESVDESKRLVSVLGKGLGDAPTRGVGKEEDAYVCAICQDVFVDPVTLTCGHSFDRHCLKEHLESKKGCPLCRAPVFLPLPKTCFALRDATLAMHPARATARQDELANMRRSAKEEEEVVLSTTGAKWTVAPAVAVLSACVAARLWPILWSFSVEGLGVFVA